MAALTGPKARKTQDGDAFRGILATSKVAFSGAYGAARTKTHADVVATPALAGMIAPYVNETGMLPLGFFETPAGDEPNESDSAGSLTGDGTKDTLIYLRSGRIMDFSVAGATANTDIFEPVYMLDDGTPSLTAPSDNTIQHGIVLARPGAGAGASPLTTSLMFSAEQMIAQSLAGGPVKDVFLGNFSWGDSADGILADGILAHNHALVVGLYAVIDIATTGAGGTTTISLTIGGTDVSTTGIVIPTATAKGTRIDIAALDGSGDETYHSGDELNVVAKSSGGTRTLGTFNLWMTVRNKPGF